MAGSAQLVAMQANGLRHHRGQPGITSTIHPAQQRATHAWCPEFFDMQNEVLKRSGTIRHRFKKGTNLVGHTDQVVDLHTRFALQVSSARRSGWVQVTRSSPRAKPISASRAACAVVIASDVGA